MRASAWESLGAIPAWPQITEPIALPGRLYRHLDTVEIVGNGGRP
jgi:hypothetical protein